MDIKLRARLSAYSKVDSISTGECAHEFITEPDIDKLFEDLDTPQSVKKDEIDNLFTEQEEPKSVSKDEIDKLFGTTDEPESVSKEDIDDLFVDGEDTVTSVSYSEIDSLFR